MMRRDPETRGAALFDEHCASCHRLDDMGPAPDKAKAPDLTGWGTAEWAMSMLDDPDAPHRFGQTPYKGEMISLVQAAARPEEGEDVQADGRSRPARDRRLSWRTKRPR